MSEQENIFGQGNVEEIDTNFKKIINDLAGEQSLDKFRVEYEKLHKALKNSYENEKKLLVKVKELNFDIVGNTSKVQTALKLTREDSQTIAALKDELQKVYKILEKQREREEKSKQKIENLHNEIKHLTALNDAGNQNSMMKNNFTEELIKEIENRKEEIVRSKEEHKNKKIEMMNANDTLKQVESQKITIELQMKEERKSKQEIEEKVQKDEDRKKKIEDELSILGRNLQNEEKQRLKLEDEIREVQNINDQCKQQEKEKDNEIKQNKIYIENAEREYQTTKKSYDSLNEVKGQVICEKKRVEEDIVKREREINQCLQEISSLKKQNDKDSNHKQNLFQKCDEAIKSKKVIINSVNQLERQVQDTKKLNSEDRGAIEDLKKARELLDKELKNSENRNKLQAADILKQEDYVRTKEIEIESKKKELDNMNKQCQSLEKEKEKLGKQAAQANAKYFHGLEEIKLKDNLISEFQKKNVETEAKLKQQQTLYEAVRSDRNLYSKNLSETQDEIAEIKRRYKIVNHQISQLKEEIDAKDVALAKEHFQTKQKEKTMEEHDRFLEKKKKEIEDKEEIIKNFVGEIGKLHFIIKDSESQRQKLKEEYEQVVADRDILGTQLIRRNDESALLYEKIKIQQKTLANGESSYRERLGDIELLRHKIKDLMRACKIYRNQCKNIKPLKHEINDTQKELIEEKLKVKALSEELENPLNAHRCRKLEGTDPDVYEMRQKLSCLQRRLISKTEQVVEKEVLIQQKEKQIQELREIMKRQPGIEEAKRISTLQQQLKSKTRSMKALAAELNMYQAQVNEYKYDIDKLNKELQETKRRYFEQRKREQVEKEQIATTNVPQVQQ